MKLPPHVEGTFIAGLWHLNLGKRELHSFIKKNEESKYIPVTRSTA